VDLTAKTIVVSPWQTEADVVDVSGNSTLPAKLSVRVGGTGNLQSLTLMLPAVVY
jgi:hypothetical protein